MFLPRTVHIIQSVMVKPWMIFIFTFETSFYFSVMKLWLANNIYVRNKFTKNSILFWWQIYMQEQICHHLLRNIHDTAGGDFVFSKSFFPCHLTENLKSYCVLSIQDPFRCSIVVHIYNIKHSGMIPVSIDRRQTKKMWDVRVFFFLTWQKTKIKIKHDMMIDATKWNLRIARLNVHKRTICTKLKMESLNWKVESGMSQHKNIHKYTVNWIYSRIIVHHKNEKNYYMVQITFIISKVTSRDTKWTKRKWGCTDTPPLLSCFRASTLSW